ncbi:DUF3016 domain-containing protein [Massilia forsythiae]|uniref:DUF3016 domain-containing protein n=1 Tax=Massilia forsythiae TaxID=2728020 RepID=A0A7Z2VZQ1_9BURK|nr:DUF3016 domain-containing protein [Massilia forsythiae]QJE02423.1 DUF3016 domain-containing protein [Massilia forsythiae]
MNRRFRLLALAGLLLASQGAALAAVTVNYVDADKFTDLPRIPWQRQQVLDDLAEHFRQLGKTLPPGQDLVIDVLDVDLAGRERPNGFSTDAIRIRERGDWPRMRLHYAFTEGGRPVADGDALLSDRNYLNRIGTYPRDERWPAEKQMIDDWWRAAIQPGRAADR